MEGEEPNGSTTSERAGLFTSVQSVGGGSGLATGRPFLVGEAGGDHIRNELSTKPPKKVFEEIQLNYGLQLPTEKERSELPVLDLLDLHKVSRAEVYLSVLTQLRTKCLERIDALPITALEKLLEITFPYIGLEELRDVPLAILKRHPNIPTTYLHKLGAKSEVYSACPIQVQRQIWQIDEDLFKGRVFPLLNQYINAELDSPANEMLVSSEELVEPGRRREQNAILQQLVQIVGKSVPLYNKMLHFFRTLFVTNRDLHFCALRSELLMALHDQGVSEIYDIDPCHQFAWCMDACVRDHAVEERRIKEMQTYFDSIPASDPVLGDLAMIINDPNCTNTLLSNVFNIVMEIVDQEKMPSASSELKYISKLLLLGLHAREMIEQQKFWVPFVEKEVLHGFFPILARKILEDMVTEENEPATTLDPDFETFFKSNVLSRKVGLYYLLTRVQAKDVGSVRQVLTKIDKGILADEPCFVQSLITQLLSTNDKAMHTLVIDEFLVEHIHVSAATHKQFLRYLLARHTRFSSQELVHYLQLSTSDVRDRDKVRPVYDMLLERVAERVNHQNAPFLFDYLGIKRPEEDHEDAYGEQDFNQHDEPLQEAPAQPTGDPEEMHIESESDARGPSTEEHQGMMDVEHTA